LVNEWLQVIILGIVEGVTEFLPISSTAHLLLTSRVLGFEHSQGGSFEIAIQFGAVLAVIGFYSRDLLAQLRGLRHDPDVRQLWLGILVAFLPAALFGLALHQLIKTVLFATPLVYAATLIGGGIIFLLVDRRHTTANTTHLRKVTLRQALAIGLAQTVALVPGVSRSGAAIVGGLLAGLDRRTATAFSFYLAIPTLGAATGIELVQTAGSVDATRLGYLLLGTAVSFVVSWLCIGWLLRYVGSHSFAPFAIYRIVLGLVLVGLVLAGQL
jgi:undecaprenyl-diphosphatase